jgi:hypothetical protein
MNFLADSLFSSSTVVTSTPEGELLLGANTELLSTSLSEVMKAMTFNAYFTYYGVVYFQGVMVAGFSGMLSG